MDTPTLPTPQRNWHAHNHEGANGWVVAPLHPSGDGSHYAAITQRLTEEDARLIAAAPDILDALELLLASYVSLVNSGDAGQWNPETDTEVIAARAALAKLKAT